MATRRPSGFLLWMFSIMLVLCQFPVHVTAVCTITPEQDISIDVPEELPVGTALVTFSVDPVDSTVTYTCDSISNPQPTDICYYMERQGFELVLTREIDIESEVLIEYVSNVGREDFIYFIFQQTTIITCRAPGELQSFSRVVQPPIINNVNEPPQLAPSFTTYVAELSLADTELVFDLDIISHDQDVNLDLQRNAFNCALLDSDIPFLVSDCITTYDPVTSFAINEAKISVAPPPPTLDFETQNYYNLTLQITDLVDYYGTVNAVNTSLFIAIRDLDDQDPRFNFAAYTATVEEEVFTGLVTILPGSIFAEDQDTLNAEIEFAFVEDNPPPCQEHLTIDAGTAEVYVRADSPFDREVVSLCEVQVKAFQRFNPVRFSTAPLVLNITDRNDNCPEFDFPTYHGIITTEDLYVMTNETQERMLITATDADMDLDFNGVITIDYDSAEGILNATDESIPGTNSKQIYIKLINPGLLDSSQTYSIVIYMEDNSIPCQSTMTSTVTIAPVDLSPRFDQPAYYESILEGVEYGTIVTTVSAVTYDNKEEGIMYLLLRATNNGELVFELNDENGQIQVISEETDATRTPEYVLFIEAQDRRSQPTRNINTAVTIVVNDTNNQCPQFTKEAYFGQITASDVYAVEEGTLTQLHLVANDNDTFITYTDIFISSGNPDNIFALEASTSYSPKSEQWSVRLEEPLLLVDGLVYNLTVTLTDEATGICQPQVIDVTIKATDLSPIFKLEEYVVSMNEGASINTVVTRVEAISYDNSTDNIFYTLKSGNNGGLNIFEINKVTGKITVVDDTTDAETVAEFTLVVVAEDRGNQPPRSASTTVIIAVNNTNDNCPKFGMERYTGTVTPQDKYVVRNDGSLDRLVLTAEDYDMIFSGYIKRLPGSSDEIFGIEQRLVTDGSAKEVYITLIDPTKLGLNSYSILVSVTDNSTVSNVPPCDAHVANVSVIITADLSPVFNVPAGGFHVYIEENSEIGTTVIKITAQSFDGTSDNIVYQLKSASDNGGDLFIMDRDTGVISVISNSTDYETIPEYTLVVEAQDRGTEPFRYSSTTVIVSLNNTNDNCPEFAETSYSGKITLQDLYVTDELSLDRLLLVANDKDMEFVGDISLIPGSGDDIFVLEEDRTLAGSSRVYIKLLDDDLLKENSYALQVIASDFSIADCNGVFTDVSIEVVSDLAPNFTQPEYSAIIQENAAIGTFVTRVEAISQNGGSDIVYILKSVSNDGGNIFTIDRVSGNITLISDDINYESVTQYTLVVEAQDRSKEPFRSASTTVIISVTNTNDNCPKFEMERYTGTVTPQDKYVVRNDGSLDRLVLTAEDQDMIFSGYIKMLPGSSDEIFGIEQRLVTDGSAKEVYITLLDPTKLGLDSYSILVSVTDNSTVSNVPPCDAHVANVSVIITADLSPVFNVPAGGFRAYIEENAEVGTTVIKISAQSFDGTSDNIVYQLKSASDNGGDLFIMDRDTGVISVISNSTDYETIPEYTLMVEAQDRGTEPFRYSSTTVIVSLNNTNDNCPEFAETSYTGKITLQDLYVTDELSLDRLLLVANDKDMEFVGDISLLPGSGDGIFELEEDRTLAGSSRVYIKLLDDDLLKDNSYALQVIASDTSIADCIGSPVDVLIEVVSDLAPNFTQPEYSGTIQENAAIGTFVTRIEAISQNGGSDIVYILKSVSNDGGNIFTIDRVSGNITLISDDTNYESVTQYTLVVEAQDRSTEPFRSATTTVFVYLTDANDNCPYFAEPTYNGKITAQDLYVVSGSGSTERLVLRALDYDTEFIGNVMLQSSPADGVFDIVTSLVSGGTVTEVYIELIDPEMLTGSEYTLKITTSDLSASCDDNTTSITIEVVRDLAPVFDMVEYKGEVMEGAINGTYIVTVNATSQNAGTSDILYTIKSVNNGGVDVFEIHRTTGDITVKSRNTDYESYKEYTLVVEAQDRGTEPPRSATTVVIVTVTDDNDNCPVFDDMYYSGQITTEDFYVVEQGKVEYLVLKASDNDTSFAGKSVIDFDTSGGSFDLESTTPSGDDLRIILMDNTGIADGQTHYLLVSMTNDDTTGNPCPPSITNVTIRVLDLSPSFPPGDYEGSVEEGADEDAFVLQVAATNKDGGSEGIVYSITWATGNGLDIFWINATTGEIFARNTIDADQVTEYTLSVVGQDVRLEPPRSDSTTVIIQVDDVNDECPVFENPHYISSLSLGDTYVLNMDGAERLVLTAMDKDAMGFTGFAKIESDSSGEGFTLESTSTSGQWYLRVSDPTVIGLDVYTVLVSVTDNTTLGDQPCGVDLTNVTIAVTDDLLPRFGKDNYDGNVPESAQPDTPVVQVTATNKDNTTDGILYRIKSATNQGQDFFKINPSTGEIFVSSDGIDAETVVEFILFVEAVDTRLEPQRSGITTVVVSVSDINDQCPVFDSAVYSGSLKQGDVYVLDGDERLIIRANDGDKTFNGSVTIDSDSSGDLFDLVEAPMRSENTKEFYIRSTDSSIDVDVYSLVVSVKDDWSDVDPPCSVNTTSVIVTVTGSDDVAPSFENTTYEGAVDEGSAVDSFIVQVTALNGEGTSDGISYLLKSASNGGENYFKVDLSSGVVSVKSSNIDAELVSEYTLFVEAQDTRTSPVLSDTASVAISVTDINDSPPVFQLPDLGYYNVSVPEDARQGYTVITVMALDADKSSELTYQLTPGLPFAIENPSVGTITVSGALNRDPPDGQGVYSIQVTATDGIKTDVANLTIIVSDVNDNGPVFEKESYNLTMLENDPGAAVIMVSAVDLDEGDNGGIQYLLESPTDKNIDVDQNTGIVTFNGPYDHEEQAEIVAVVRASDNGVPPMSAATSITLTITDVNDNTPIFVQNGCEEAQVSEDSPENTVVCTVLATDGDAQGSDGAMITYTLKGPDIGFFYIEEDSEGYGLLKLSGKLDRELKAEYHITIVASDWATPPLSEETDAIIRVSDVNDEPPEFSSPSGYRKSFNEELSPGTLVISVATDDADEAPFSTVLCNLTSVDGSHQYFYVNSDGRVCTVSTQQILPVRTSGPYVITVLAYNPDQPELNNQATINVYVNEDLCFVVIDPADYFAMLEVGDVNAGEGVVRVNASSPCGNDGLVFNITRQTLTPSPIDPPINPSSEFAIKSTTGEVYSTDDNPSYGTHYMEVIAYNASNPDSSIDTGYVTIVIIPNANNPPAFDNALYNADPVLAPKLKEHPVIDLGWNATDPDYPLTGVGEIVFGKLSEERDNGEATNYFMVSENGQVSLATDVLEVEEALNINLMVKVEDKGVPPLSDAASVMIAIEPPASKPPVFVDPCSGDRYVDEGSNSPYLLCKLLAEGSSSITYSVDDNTNFDIYQDGSLVTLKEFNYEVPTERQFKVLVTASSTDGLSATTGVSVIVRDINDAEPIFNQDPYEFSIMEDVASGGCAKFVGQVQATDADFEDDYAYIEYRLLGAPDFAIDAISGIIETTTCIDRESKGGLVDFVVVAANTRATPILDTEATVQIMIGDENDNNPVFQQDRYTVLLGSLPPDTELITVRAQDVDQGENAEIYYLIAQDQRGSVYEYFTVDRLTGVLSTTPTAELPPDEGLEETILIEAWDNGSPPRKDDTEVVVSVTPGYLDEPIFREIDKEQGMSFVENVMEQCFEFTPPLYDEQLLLFYTIVDDTSGGKIDLDPCRTVPRLCNIMPLDRELEAQYFVVVEGTTCNVTSNPECVPCAAGPLGKRRMSRKVDRNDAAHPSAVQSNQMVVDIAVLDLNDVKPVVTGFVEGLPNKYYIGVADDVPYNTTIFKVEASDVDTNSSLIYDLSLYNTPLLAGACQELPNFKMNNNGSLIARDAYYLYLDLDNGDVDLEQSVCEYVVTVTDDNTDADYLDRKSVSIPAKIKVLFSFEHAIIMIDLPPELVVVDAEQIASCLSVGLNDYILRVEYVRAQLLEETRDVTKVDPERTDLWVYAINDKTGIFAKYWEIKSAWDASTVKDLCGVALIGDGIRPAYLRRDYLYPYASYVGWAVLALAAFIALATLICIFMLYHSWDQMVIERTHYMTTVMLGTDNFAYEEPRYVETGMGTDTWDDPMPLEEKKTKPLLFESQEMSMNLFAEYADYEAEDQALLTVIRDTSSPTEVHVIVDHKEWERDREEIFTITKETTTVLEVIDVQSGAKDKDGSDGEPPVKDQSKKMPKGDDQIGDDTSQENSIQGLITYFSSSPTKVDSTSSSQPTVQSQDATSSLPSPDESAQATSLPPTEVQVVISNKTTDSTSTSSKATKEFKPGKAKPMPPIITWDPKGDPGRKDDVQKKPRKASVGKKATKLPKQITEL